ncbi:MAG: hypothetical protein JOZ72_18120 [Alphaproteobacteria bacterium]|nr:hypothetical protein [Alphaproteobacteria bacterium]
MFNTPTVFILGAGASWHYGYPTGEGLVRKVVEKADAAARYFDFRAISDDDLLPDFLQQRAGGAKRAERWQAVANEARMLGRRLKQANPTLIDYFLRQNADLHEIGKLVVAMVIFDCEIALGRERANPNHRERQQLMIRRGQLPVGSSLDPTAFEDDWLRFVLYKLTSRCEESADLLRNEVTFVTFNYDTSLEQRLIDGLRSVSLFQKADIDEFLRGDRVLHVYGKVRSTIDPPWEQVSTAFLHSSNDRSSAEVQQAIGRCHQASLGIRTVDGPEKVSDEAVLGAASKAVAKARKLFILGYGFDQSNSERIGLTSLRRPGDPNRAVFFTNYGGHNRVSIAASRAMTGRHDAFLPGSGISRHLNCRFEMSTKNVYDALNEDFESLETD